MGETELATERKAYNEGREAYYAGEHINSNTTPSGEGRVAWFRGYLDARTGKRLRKVFRRNAIRWP